MACAAGALDPLRDPIRYGPNSQVLGPPFDDYTDLLLPSVPEIRLGWLESVIDHRKMVSADN